MDKKKVLIVDDEPDIVETIQFMLESEGFECLAAYDGEDALLKARTENPDLILLDIIKEDKIRILSSLISCCLRWMAIRSAGY